MRDKVGLDAEIKQATSEMTNNEFDIAMAIKTIESHMRMVNEIIGNLGYVDRGLMGKLKTAARPLSREMSVQVASVRVLEERFYKE